MSIDLWFNQHIPLVQNSNLTKIMTFITGLGDLWVLLPLSIFFILSLLYKKRWRKATISILSLFFGLVTSELLKMMINRSRPENALILETDPSFPSGHALMSAIFFILLVYSYKNDIRNKALKNLFIIVCLLIPLLIGLSRLYLNVHWFSDVIVGFVIAVFWTGISIFVEKKINKK